MPNRTRTTQPLTRRDTVQVLASRRPRERYVRDALRQLDSHRFAARTAASPLKPSSDA